MREAGIFAYIYIILIPIQQQQRARESRAKNHSLSHLVKIYYYTSIRSSSSNTPLVYHYPLCIYKNVHYTATLDNSISLAIYIYFFFLALSQFQSVLLYAQFIFPTAAVVVVVVVRCSSLSFCPVVGSLSLFSVNWQADGYRRRREVIAVAETREDGQHSVYSIGNTHTDRHTYIHTKILNGRG